VENLLFKLSLYKNACAFSLCFVLAAVMSGCGAAAPETHTPVLQVNGFDEYVARFEQAATEHEHPVQVQDLIIRFGQVDEAGESGGRGVCQVASGETPVITVSAEAWATSTEEEREELIFHELGHCVLGLAHQGGINAQGIPASLMNPYKIHGGIYRQFKDYYLAQLFAE
jgi:Zn-dependent protease with chaperone function